MNCGRQIATPGYIALITACLLLNGCSSKPPLPAKGSYKGATYTVKRGDTLFRIARMSNHSMRELAQLNGISAPYTIQVGQTLRLKGSSGVTQTAAQPRITASTKRTSSAAGRPVTQVAAPPVGDRCWIWPTQGKVIVPFSSAQGGNKGIDIAGKRGQPIYAAGTGNVVYAGDKLRGYGNLVMIKHDANYITAYAHNDTLLVHSGQKVSRGQKIATMGSSGSTSVNLHFQLRYKATAVDPLRYLPASGSTSNCN